MEDFINYHGARGSPVEEILANAADMEPFDHEADLALCTMIIYGIEYIINEKNFECIYKFGYFFQLREICSEVKRWIDEELTYNKFWEVYIKLRKLNANTSLFVYAISKHLRGSHYEDFLKCTKKLVEEKNVNNVATASELLLTVVDISMFNFVLDLASIVR